MTPGIVVWIALAIGALIAFLFAQMLYLNFVLRWADEATTGLGYYGHAPAERERFKRTLRRHAVLLAPILRLIGRLSTFTFDKVSFRHGDLPGPQGTCNKDSFARADAYQARPEDVFVVTQMKCGTTWMQHVVYEVLRRGAGDIVESGTTLYAVCPWLESNKSVSMEEAPLVGTERPSRVVKTHFPAEHCPVSPESRYIYVARHPVSCFASCVDFIATNLGIFGPKLEQLEEWFCSRELMWWGTWTDHVKGWWHLSEQHDNVMFVHFEEMKRDLPAIAQQVAEFLGVAPLTEGELERVVHKCGFEYMQQHKDAFEMQPPNLLAVEAALFVSGTADRHRDVPDATRERIARWCVGEMAGSAYPLQAMYPDIAAAGV
ncbi:MAG: sulfotransferase domain-containing protein [Planctomycetota bacterium]|jgi:hypothetical protein